MIEVKNNRIYFYNMNKRDIIPVDFQCVSAYLCPHCKKVLAAYYAGKIVDLESFMEDPALKYHYTLGTSNGGQYLLLDDHNHKKGCPGWEIVSLSARSITYSIDVWARSYEVGPEKLAKLCKMIDAGKVPGFDIVQDACGADDPIVLYNEHLFTNMNKPGFGQSFIRKENLAAYADWIIAEDYSKPFEPPIKLKTEPPIDAPKDDLPSMVDIETETGDQSTKSVFGDVIDVYSRAEAIDDGLLVDVTETAKEAGIVYPTAVTQALWNGYIEPPDSLKGFQDMQGRLWDVLTMFSFSARARKKASTEVAESPRDAAQILYFKTMFQMPSKAGNSKMETVDLKAICGPGDNAEPILTIMLLEED
ncbi:hypothetical protein METP3_02259 [Methanosarcinales archaeon]|nr:hypothetical protein METP3_02259 [Methanosarcinales archaeon]